MSERSNLESTVDTASAHFTARFGRRPNWIAAAPGRVNLIGEHVDYNSGLVLPMAIDRYAVVAGDVSSRFVAGMPVTTIYSDNIQCEVVLDANLSIVDLESDQGQSRETKGWANYLRGVIDGFARLGFRIPPLDMLIHSSIPLGGGLSSSAGLEVGIATFLEAVLDCTLDRQEKARLCQRAEHDFAGVPCGIMDQTISIFGESQSLLLLDCRDQSIQQIPFDDFQVAVLILNSHVQHDLVASQYSARLAECRSAEIAMGVESLRDVSPAMLARNRDRLDSAAYLRTRHVVSEIERTIRFVDAVKNKNWPAAGEIMYLSHQSLRDDYQVSCQEVDCLVDAAMSLGIARGVFGSRMTGAGFGGCSVSLIASESADQIIGSIGNHYFEQTGRRASALVTRPVQGAKIIVAPN